LKTDILDVAIIGGGAAGLCSAVKIKGDNNNFSVAVFEQLSRVGKKLITTGNGRCNITNKNINEGRYHSENLPFVSYALSTYTNEYTENFFADLGVVFTYDDEGRAYPYSLQAASVVDGLRFRCDNLGVVTYTETTVSDVIKQNNIFLIKTDKGDFYAKTVIVATGLYSGGNKLGSTGKFYKMMKTKGYKCVNVTPAIVQLKTDNTLTKSLKGIKVNANATLYFGKEKLRTEYGEVLFCDYGLSGPPIMQISREASRRNGKFKVCLDIMPEYDFNEVCEMLESRVKSLKGGYCEEFFTGLLNKRVGQQIIKLSSLKFTEKNEDIKPNHIKTMAKYIKALEFEVLSTTGFENSQVTAGGIDTREIDDKTMMSKKEKGLYFIGEILDVDGDCGGFNLQWAWSSAFCCADSVEKYLKG